MKNDPVAERLRLMDERDKVLEIGLLTVEAGLAVLRFVVEHPAILEDTEVSDKINALKAFK